MHDERPRALPHLTDAVEKRIPPRAGVRAERQLKVDPGNVEELAGGAEARAQGSQPETDCGRQSLCDVQGVGGKMRHGGPRLLKSESRAWLCRYVSENVLPECRRENSAAARLARKK